MTLRSVSLALVLQALLGCVSGVGVYIGQFYPPSITISIFLFVLAASLLYFAQWHAVLIVPAAFVWGAWVRPDKTVHTAVLLQASFIAAVIAIATIALLALVGRRIPRLPPSAVHASTYLVLAVVLFLPGRYASMIGLVIALASFLLSVDGHYQQGETQWNSPPSPDQAIDLFAMTILFEQLVLRIATVFLVR